MVSNEYVCTKDGSNKFWKYEMNGIPNREATVVRLIYGRIGTAGTTEVKQFSSWSGAEKYVQSRVKDKLRKGYVKVDGTQYTTVTSTVKSQTPEEVIESAWDL